MKEKMNVKKTLVSFLTIATLLLSLVAVIPTIRATEIASDLEVEVDGIDALSNEVSVIAGEKITVKVFFTSEVGTPDLDEDDSDYTDGSNVRIEVEIEGKRQDVDAKTAFFDVEEGKRYVKTLTLQVPYELKDEKSDELTLSIKIWNVDFRTEEEIVLGVQRPSYNADIFAINSQSVVEAGEMFPVEVVLKNRGYNNLEDTQVTLSIAELGIEETAYFGDLVSMEMDDDDDDDVDTVSGRIYLRIPDDAEAGTYLLEVIAENEDTVSSEMKEILVENEFPEQVMKTSDGLLFINPTNNLKIYKIVLPTEDEEIVSVQAGSSNEFEVVADSDDYVVSVLTMDGKVVESFSFEQTGQESKEALGSPVAALTIILAIIFIVLLVVLIVLLTKKPERSEEIGESYY